MSGLDDIETSIQKERAGITVQDVIDKLMAVKDKSRYVCFPSWDGLDGVFKVEEETVTGYAGCYSFEETDVVILR